MKPQIPIEPLSEARWGRVERELFEALAASPVRPSHRAPTRASVSRPFALVMAGAAAAVAGGLALHAAVGTPRAPATTRVMTDGAGSHLALADASLEVSPQSGVVVSGDDVSGYLVLLDHGSVDFSVGPRGNRPAFLVQAADVTVRVVGTRFTVDRHDGFVGVRVREGTVEVTRSSSRSLVHAGEAWSSEPPAIASPPGPPVDAPPATSPATRPAAPPVSIETQAHAPAERTAPKSVLSPRERYEKAAGLEASHPDQAVAAYRELASGSGGPWAMNALFAEARLEAERGNRAQASTLLHTYLSRYPNGPNAGDAGRLLDRLR